MRDYCLLREGARTFLCRHGAAVFEMNALKIAGRTRRQCPGRADWATPPPALAAMLEALETFPGLPHRSAWVADVGGARYVDDSKGTNVGATLAAVVGQPGPLVVIAGGLSKGQDFAPLAAAFKARSGTSY